MFRRGCKHAKLDFSGYPCAFLRSSYYLKIKNWLIFHVK